MIKILFFIPRLSAGGAEKVLRTLVNNMDKRKFDITVHTMEEDDAKKYLVPEIHYKAINKCKTSIGKKVYQYWIRLCAELKILYPLYIKDNYDIEVAYLECGATKIISSSTNKEAVKLAWVHCDLAKKEGFSDNIEKSKKYYEKFDKVVCVSEDVRKSFLELVGDKPEAIVLHNVNDEEEIIAKSKEFNVEKKGNGYKTLVAVGRLTYQKGFDRLLEACNLLKKNGDNVELLILGEGEERNNLERIIEELELSKEVKLLGFQENPYPYIKAADVVVCSSRYEGFSTVLTEALILGKSVVTTPCTGMEEILGNSEYGVITEDSSEGLAEGIRKVIETSEGLAKYSTLAQERGKRFSKKEILEKTEDFFTNWCL